MSTKKKKINLKNIFRVKLMFPTVASRAFVTAALKAETRL